MKIILPLTFALSLIAVPAIAQEVSGSDFDPIIVEGNRLPSSVQENFYLPANTSVLLRMSEDVTTKGKRWFEGEVFSLAVAQNVTMGDTVVIPAGSRAVGVVTWLSNPGVFGKTGKIEVSLEYVETDQHRIELEGTYRQEGAGKTQRNGLLRRLFGRMLSGDNAVIPTGHELTATTQYHLTLAATSRRQGQP